MEKDDMAGSDAARDLVTIVLTDDWSLKLDITPLPVIIILCAVMLAWLCVRFYFRTRFSDFQIDSAEFGLGDSKVTIKANDTDRQIAYSIWVELSTRKIGLPIDPNNDVIVEIYDSWYEFFGITRELVKDIPVFKARESSTSKIIDLSVEVLNEGLRPHLTKWQARFRHWYERKMDVTSDVEPQELQKQFPAYDELIADMLTVNQHLIKYREKMNELAKA